MAATKTLEERQEHFKKRIKELYPDYELITEYVNVSTKVTLKHKDGYLWSDYPRYLNGKKQCPEVSKINKSKNNKKISIEEINKRFYNKFNKEDYEIFCNPEYKNQKDKVKVLHKKCNNYFYPTIKSIIGTIRNCGCPYCYKKSLNTLEGYNEKFHNNEELKDYDILEIWTKDGHTYGKVKHNCDKCNNSIFNIRLSDMISKHRQRCPICKIYEHESKAAKDITNYLIKNHINFIKEKHFDSCKDIEELPFDFYLTEYNLLIEYDGIQHYKEIEYFGGKKYLDTIQKHDNIKNNWCSKNNIDLLRIKYTIKDYINYLNDYLNKNFNISCSV